MSVSVCLHACSRAYLWNHWSELHQVTWPWLVPPLAALGTGNLDTLCNSGYGDDVIFSYTRPHGGMSTDVAATPLQRRAKANTPGAWC